MNNFDALGILKRLWNSVEISRLAANRGSRIIVLRDVERKSSALSDDRAKFHGKRRVFTLSGNRWWLFRRLPIVRRSVNTCLGTFHKGNTDCPTIYRDERTRRCIRFREKSNNEQLFIPLQSVESYYSRKTDQLIDPLPRSVYLQCCWMYKLCI